MRNSITRLLTVLLMGALFAGCTGYDEGPAINFRNAETKLVRPWRVTKAAIGGAVTTQFVGDLWTFQEGGGFNITDVDFTATLPPGLTITNQQQGRGEWRFVERPAALELFYAFDFNDPANPAVSYRREHQDVWTIVRFTQLELWVRRGEVALELSAL